MVTLAGCDKQNTLGPLSSDNTSRTFVYIDRDNSGRLLRSLKDTLIEAIPGSPDSVIAARVYDLRYNPVTRQLEQDQGFPTVQQQKEFIQAVLTDPALSTGPNPITFPALKKFLAKCNLSLADLFLAVDTTTPAGMRYYALLDACYEKFRTTYEQGYGFGADLDLLLHNRALAKNDFMDAVDASGFTPESLAEHMEQNNVRFTDIEVAWFATGDSSLRGLTQALRNMPRNEKIRIGNVTLLHRSVTGGATLKTILILGLGNQAGDIVFERVPFGFFDGSPVHLSLMGNSLPLDANDPASELVPSLQMELRNTATNGRVFRGGVRANLVHSAYYYGNLPLATRYYICQVHMNLSFSDSYHNLSKSFTLHANVGQPGQPPWVVVRY